MEVNNIKYIDNRLRRFGRRRILPVACLIATLASLIGMFPLVVILLLAVILVYVRFPGSINSIFGKSIISIFILYSALQLAGAVQFLLIPTSDFRAIGVITSLIVFCLALFVPATTTWRNTLLETKDVFAFVCAAVFTVPVIGFGIVGSPDMIAKIGAIQGLDGVNHFATIAELSNWQHFRYAQNSYYPGGFHIATAFVQSAFGVIEPNLSWVSMARLYIIQYGVMGAGMLYILARFAFAIIDLIDSKRQRIYGKTWPAYLTAAGLIGISVTTLYFSSFTYHGFLSYFYVCAALCAALLYLVGLTVKGHMRPSDKLLMISMYAFVTLGVTMSWPLWLPVIYLSIMLALVAMRLDLRTALRPLLLIGAFMAFHLIAVYFQLKFNSGDSTQGINLTGGLRVFHLGTVTAAIVLLGGSVWWSITKSERTASLLIFTLLPASFLVLAIAFMQYIVVGEVRYYGIKTAEYLEIMTITIVAGLAGGWMLTGLSRSQAFIAIPSVIFAGYAIFVMLIAFSGNPFQDARLLLRNISNEPTPAFFMEDTKELTDIGAANKMTSDSVISLHANEREVLYTHMQAFYWAGMMSYDGSIRSRDDMARCNGAIYGNFFRQDFSEKAQDDLKTNIDKCIQLAITKGQRYYIVTDDKSEPVLRKLFGNKVTYL